MFPGSKQYFHFFPFVLMYFAGREFDHFSAHRSSNFSAVALWLPPNVIPDEEALGSVLGEGVAPELREEVFAALDQVGAGHSQKGHCYLPKIGTEPLSQGKGYGSALLTRNLRVCDCAHVAVYLEAANTVNILLYHRFGFEVIGEIQVGGSPTSTPMFRVVQ